MASFTTRLIEEHIVGDDTPDGPWEWDVAYDLGMTSSAVNVTIKVKLVGVDPGALRGIWEKGVERHWNDKAYFSDGTTLYKINFAFNYVTAGEHQVVTVHAGSGNFDMNNWYIVSEGWPDAFHDETSAHEAGHMFGLPDEYEGGATFDNYTTTGTLMSDLTVMSSETDAGYERYFGPIKHHVEVHGFNESNPNVDTLQLVLAKLGDAGANSLTGTAGMDALLGLGGNDMLRGLGGNDRLEGSAGNDTLIGGFGVNFIDGGNGTDTADYRFYDGTIDVNLTKGTATFPPSTAADTLVAIENVLAGNGDDILTGNAAGNMLHGGGGADWLEGRAGNDVYNVDNIGDRVVEAALSGTDTVITTASYVLTGGSEIETLRTSDTALKTAMNLSGNEVGQTIQGNGGTNVINGLGGADTMSGFAGNDAYWVDMTTDKIVETVGQGTDQIRTTSSFSLSANVSVEVMQTATPTATTALNLIGNAYINFITGNAGNNMINGAGGNDTLTGLGGVDSFRFSVAPGSANIDTIRDFNVADDEMQLENGVFTALSTTPGILNADAFHIGAAAADPEDRIVYNNAIGGLYYDPDGTGSQTKVQFGSMSAGLTMTNLDFEIV